MRDAKTYGFIERQRQSTEGPTPTDDPRCPPLNSALVLLWSLLGGDARGREGEAAERDEPLAQRAPQVAETYAPTCVILEQSTCIYWSRAALEHVRYTCASGAGGDECMGVYTGLLLVRTK